MSADLPEKGMLRAWRPQRWVFGLDRWLRRLHGIYEYTADPECLFRAERSQAKQRLKLSDGVRVEFGDTLLQLHLWNEHMPPMGQGGPSVAWGRRISRAIDVSLRELAWHLAELAERSSVVAVYADMHLATPRQGIQLARIVRRFGFEVVPRSQLERPGVLRLIGENILVVLLVLATNPVSLRAGLMRRGYTRLIISRAKLERCYCDHAPRPQSIDVRAVASSAGLRRAGGGLD